MVDCRSPIYIDSLILFPPSLDGKGATQLSFGNPKYSVGQSRSYYFIRVGQASLCTFGTGSHIIHPFYWRNARVAADVSNKLWDEFSNPPHFCLFFSLNCTWYNSDVSCVNCTKQVDVGDVYTFFSLINSFTSLLFFSLLRVFFSPCTSCSF